MQREEQRARNHRICPEVVCEGSHTVVHLDGELDLESKQELRNLLEPLSGVVIVDLAKVTFVDSAAMGIIAFAGRHIADKGGELWLRAPAAVPRRSIELMGFGDWIET